MITLLPHQVDAITAVETAEFLGVQKQLVQMATGAGKTIFSGALASRRISSTQRILFVAPRKQIAEHAIDEFANFIPRETMGLVQGEHNEYYKQHLFATVQTAERDNRLAQILARGKFDLIVFDEAHRSIADSWLKVWNACHKPDALLIGLTATPMRSDRRSLKILYDECTYSIGMIDLIAMDPPLLCDLRGYRIHVPDLDLSHIKRTDDDELDEKELAIAIAHSKLRHQLAVENILRYAGGPHGEPWPGLTFNANVADAHAFAKFCNENGIPSAAITTRTSESEREQIEADFDAGKIRNICNFSVFTEGIDKPQARWIMMMRHTNNQGTYVQAVGRGARLLKGEHHLPLAQRKKQFTIVFDMADNKHTVIVLPDMLGTTEEKAKNKSVRELIKDKIVEPVREPKEIVYKPGSTDVRVQAQSLFTSRHWQPIGYDGQQWVCQSPVGKVFVEKDFAGSGYTAHFVSPNGQKRNLKDFDTTKVELVFGAGEQYLAQLEHTAQWKTDHKDDLASPQSLERLYKALPPARFYKKKLTIADVDALWADKDNWWKDSKYWWVRNKKKKAAPTTTTTTTTTPRTQSPVRKRAPRKLKDSPLDRIAELKE